MDTDPEPEDFSFTVVSDDCSTVLKAIENINPEFAELIEDVIVADTPKETYAVFTDEEASITVLVPPRTSANGLLYAHSKGNVSAVEVCCHRACMISDVGA